MKAGHDITVNRARVKAPPGGDWAALDPVAQGRVCLLDAGPGDEAQAVAALDELVRLSRLDPDWSWRRCAVIARDWRRLEPVRAYAEALGIPIDMANETLPSLWRLREMQAFIRVLLADRTRLLTIADLVDVLNAQPQLRTTWSRRSGCSMRWESAGPRFCFFRPAGLASAGMHPRRGQPLEGRREGLAEAPVVFAPAPRREAGSGALPDPAEPLARQVSAGVPHVLGWDGSVYDSDASGFAEALYGALAQGETVPKAAARARRALFDRAAQVSAAGRHWHLARLYLGPGGGGRICDPHKPPRTRCRPRETPFLDPEAGLVPVAGPPSSSDGAGRCRA